MSVNSEPSFLRPSALPRLDECIHYRSDGLPPGPYADRGSKIDALVQQFLKGEPPASWKLEEAPEVAAAQWVSDQAKKFLEKIECQRKLELWDMFVTPPEMVLKGVCDIVGTNKEDGVMELWDVKSGRTRDYDAQLQCYALMLMDETQEVEVRLRIAYCDQKVLDEKIVSRSHCERVVFGIVERVRLGVEPPQENDYCYQCARQPTCPVWIKPSEIALSVLDVQPLVDMAPALDPALEPQSRLELIKKDPRMLGQFIDAWRKAEKLIEKADLEGYAKELLLQGIEVPGWRITEQSRAFYDKTQIEKILREWGESAADFLAVNRERYEGACANSDQDFLEPEGRTKSFYKLLKKK